MSSLLSAGLIALAALHSDPDSCGGAWQVGESLYYQVSLAPFGPVGHATFRVLPSDSMAAADAGVVFASDVRARVLFMAAQGTHRSWYDPREGRTRAYITHEREMGRSHRQDIRIDDQGRWEDEVTGEVGESPHDAPLDPLAFLYVVRDMPLLVAEELTLRRHFREEDNPVRITVLPGESLQVGSRHIPVIRLDVRFQPRRLFDGGGRTTLFLADDGTRRLVRMNMYVSIAGHLQLDLEPERSRFGCRSGTAPPRSAGQPPRADR